MSQQGDRRPAGAAVINTPNPRTTGQVQPHHDGFANRFATYAEID
jgi:hypothetical protein